MAEITYAWPSREKSRLLGKSHDRIDGIAKATGEAKYTYDVNLKNQLIVKCLSAPHGHMRITRLDVAPAKAVPGVVHVHVFPHAGVGKEIQWEGELLVAVAGETESAAREGVAAIELEYEKLDVFVNEEDLEAAKKAGRTMRERGSSPVTEREPGEDEDEDEFAEAELRRLFDQCDVVVEGYYGIPVITHCCLETHGSTLEFHDGKLRAYLSTQNVSGTDDGFARPLEMRADDVEVICQYIGGGFGSKFAPGYWGIAAARIAQATGRPVKFMLDRDQELKIAGNRPSGYIRVRLGADRNGEIKVWDSHQWGTSGYRGGGVSDRVVPYVIQAPNRRVRATPVKVNAMQAAAWRAPNHPQACVLTQCALDDLAAKLGISSLDVFLRNAKYINSGQKAEVYVEELKRAAELIGWKEKWHPHGKGPAKGSVVEGLGIALHTWGGVANNSECRLRIYPDGAVESFCGTQDLGTGTRTVCALVLAETFGLDVSDVRVNIGDSKYPPSGASGGSTTVGAVCESHRRAAQMALAQLFEKVAPKLSAKPDELEVGVGCIQVRGKPDRSLSWREACATLGLKRLEVTASHRRGQKSPLSSEGVGGVQMAHVAVDRDTGVVRIKKFVAVQDMGLIVNRKTATSQVHGAVIMGIAYALFEERILDPTTGVFLNAELSDYKLPRLGDVGEIVVDLYEPDEERARGVIGLGEPPVISPGAAISNAVCNALGVRVPVLPMTPKRVLDAIRQANGRG